MKTKTYLLPVLFSLFILVMGCKKDQLIVDQTKEFAEDKVSTDYRFGGWHLTLSPDGTANVNPGGDIVYRGTYKINGSTIKVKTEQNAGSYTFEIISETEIKEKEYGSVLKLKQ